MRKRLIALCFSLTLMLSACQSAPEPATRNEEAHTRINVYESGKEEPLQKPTNKTENNISTEEETTNLVPAQGNKVGFQIEGTFLELVLPIRFQLTYGNPFEGESYIFTDLETGIWFGIGCSFDTKENQEYLLRKLYNPKLGFTIQDNIIIGDNAFFVYSEKDTPFSYGFLLKDGVGYSYRFMYCIPPEQSQYEIPKEAIEILSSITITKY